jgi:hypothetical protein
MNHSTRQFPIQHAMVGLVAERMWNVEIAAADKTTTKTVM